MRLTHDPRPTTVRADDAGFTLPEVITAVGITMVVLVGFTLFLTQLLGSAASVRVDLVATRVAASQLEATNRYRWDDLMVGSGECAISGGGQTRRSTAAVRPGPERVTVDATPLAVTRNVTWEAGGAQVVCGNADRDGLKVVTVTVTYNDGAVQRTKTLSQLRSRWTE